MSKNHRVLNITRGHTLKFKQAEKAVDSCACTWVEYGKSIRDLTLAESIAQRHKQVKELEPLPMSELPGIIFQPPTAKRQDFTLLRIAREYVACCQN